MFELESFLKLFDKSDTESEIPLSINSAREIADKFSTIRTALRRIISLDEKNVAKYAQQIARDALGATNG